MTLPNSSSLPKTADAVILGAGVMGTSIAFYLAKRKAGNIVVIDKGFAAIDSQRMLRFKRNMNMWMTN